MTNEADKVFEECLDELEAEQRQVLTLRFKSAMSNEKIAQRLNMPVKTVEKKIWDARLSLSQKLELRLLKDNLN